MAEVKHTPGANRMVNPGDIGVGDVLWDFGVTAVKVADTGNRYRVTATGKTSGVSITRCGYNPKAELLRILAGYGSNNTQP